MTIKRINFTDRKRIVLSKIQISLTSVEPRPFMVDFSDLLNEYPKDAKVFLEATSAGSPHIQRYDFGTVENCTHPKDANLKGLEGRNVFFTLKIVDVSESIGRILGMAEHIRPISNDQNESLGILPVEYVELEDELWRLKFTENGVFLLVDNSIPDVQNRVNSDPLFFSMIFPVAIRTIFSKALMDNYQEDDDYQQVWIQSWLSFGKHIHPDHSTPPKSDDGDDAHEEWIEEVVHEFCNKHKLKQRFLDAIGK